MAGSTAPVEPLVLPPGDLTINSLGLYPENADHDPKREVVYFSSLFNNKIEVYDVRKGRVTESITIPGITGSTKLHTSGVELDQRHDRLSIVSGASTAFSSGGQNISGDYWLHQYNLQENKFDFQLNIRDVLGAEHGGCQDVEHDRSGNAYVLGSWASSIVKVAADGASATPWYLDPEPDHTVMGFGGIQAVHGGDTLLVADCVGGKILRFDARGETGTPVRVPLQEGAEPLGEGLDGVYAPPSLGEEVLLVSHPEGTEVIYSAGGGWDRAKNLGRIPNAHADEGGWSVTTVEFGGRIYVVNMYFGDEAPAGKQDRVQFPLDDVTDDIKKLVAEEKKLA